MAVNLSAEGLSLPKLLGLAQDKGFSGFKLDFANSNKLSEASKHPKDEIQLLFIQLVAEKKMYLRTLSEPTLMCVPSVSQAIVSQCF